MEIILINHESMDPFIKQAVYFMEKVRPLLFFLGSIRDLFMNPLKCWEKTRQNNRPTFELFWKLFYIRKKRGNMITEVPGIQVSLVCGCFFTVNVFFTFADGWWRREAVDKSLI